MQTEDYCGCGCGQAAPIADRNVARKGWIKGQPQRFVHGHNRRQQVQYRVEDRGYTTPCWIWQMAKNLGGYGQVRDGSEFRPAHRVFYERHVGPIPEGLDLDHLCRQRDCVNPAHLEPVTAAENTRRGLSAKIDMATATLIRQRIATGERQVDIARSLGVSQQLVCDIKKGRKWVAL